MKFLKHKRENDKKTRGIYIENAIAPIYGCMMLGILLMCIFLSQIAYGRDWLCSKYLPAILLLIVGGIFVTGVAFICKSIDTNCLHTRNVVLIVSLILFAAQVYCVWNYYFYTDWDAGQVTFLANSVAHGEGVPETLENYFSLYPNNLLLVYIFSIIMKLAHFVGVHNYEYFALLCVQCMLNSATGFFLYKVLDELFERSYLSIVGYAIYFLMLGISPWISIPYSDSMALIFPILIIYIYLNRARAKNTFLIWFAITILSVIGYKIKPQVLIVFIAIFMISVISTLRTLKTQNKTGIACKILAVIVGFVCACVISKMAVSSLKIEIDENKTFNIQHFFMMGMNPEDMGIWSETDVGFSASFDTVEARNAGDMELAKERIKDMGVVGLAKQFVRKTLTNYNNGTFCWAGEGTFFVSIPEEKSSRISGLLKGLYYTRDWTDVGKYYVAWSNFEQMLWLTVLMLSVFSTFAQKGSEKNVIMLAIIGLTIFELIFEARARYLYTYVPLYITLAMYGVDCISKRNMAT